MGGEWSSYRGGQFNGGNGVMLQRWAVYEMENSHVTELTSLMEGEWSCFKNSQFNGQRMVMLERCSV